MCYTLEEALKYRLVSGGQIIRHTNVNELVSSLLTSDIEGTILCVVPSEYERDRAITLLQNSSLCIVNKERSMVNILHTYIYLVTAIISADATSGFRLEAVHIVRS